MKLKILPIILLLIVSCNPSKEVTETTDAKFIFRATIEKIGEATLPEISNTSNCIVAKVNEVILAPADFADWTGKSITISVEEPGKKKPGLEQVFYTNGWLYGKSIAVIEIESSDSREVTSQQVLKKVQAGKDKKVRERLKRTELVVTGRILDVKEAEVQGKDSEHDPLWKTAIIQIDTLLKGRTNKHEVAFRFASSYDIMWSDSPKFKVGGTGIWLLRTKADQDKVYTITDPEDYFPIESIEYIHSLLK